MDIFSWLHTSWSKKYFFRKVLLITLTACFVFNVVLFLIIHNRPKQKLRPFQEEIPAHSKEPHGDPISPLLERSINETVLSVENEKSEVQNEEIGVPKNTKLASSKSEKSACPRMTIHHQDEIEHFSKNRTCQPHLPTEEICQYTAELFSVDPSIEECHDQMGKPYTLCSIVEKSTEKPNPKFEAKCDLSACDSKKPMRLKIIHPSNGELLLLDLSPGTSENAMQQLVRNAAKTTRHNGFNFLFIECAGHEYSEKVSQMLTLLPPGNIFKRRDQISSKKINVNIVLLDSISRAHFFRSLPKTVRYLQEKQNDPDFEAHIFDFELFQSVHGHTHENEHALFSGTLFPQNYSREQKESSPTNMEVLFGTFKRSGYQTLFQNDMCWKSYYGLTDSFKASDWNDLREKLKPANSNIDSTGITDAACEIYEKYGKVSPFNDDNNHQVCFNGKHHHRHLFDYLVHYLQAVGERPQSKPLFSYTETNVAHDDEGVRVRTLDRDLTEFIDIMAKDPNTFTVIFADHGNTYTEYQIKMLEGRLEMYHPILLAIVPKQLGKKLGENILTNLKTNQYRLLNNLDIRAGLVEIAKYDGKSKLNPVGILGEISEKRTCNDLQLSKPNYCLCEGWDMPVRNSTAQMALAEFAIGQLNNKIQESLLASQRNREPSDQQPILFGACQRLRIQSIQNVLQHHTAKGTMMTTIDVTLQSGNIVEQEELITVEVESNQRKGNTFEMKLVSFNRISQYGIYRQCVDRGVDVRLCICNKPNGGSNGSSILSILGARSRLRKLKPCLVLIKRKYGENVGQEDFVGVHVFEIMNNCSDQQFTVTFDAETRNLRSSSDLPVDVTLRGNTVYFVTVFMTEVGYWKTELKWRFRVETEPSNGKRNKKEKKHRSQRKREKTERKREYKDKE